MTRSAFATRVAPALAAVVAFSVTTPDVASGQGDAASTFAFVGVNVIPMDSERVLGDQTVVVEGRTIVAVGPTSSVAVPGNATVIDGNGRYLMPGLAEMHAHVPPVQGNGWPNRDALEDIMFLYLANGVTSIRGMLGAPYQIELSDELESMQMIGPTFYVGAPSLNGGSAPNPQAAAALIEANVRAGYDLQKIHPGFSRETWDRMDAVADRLGFTYGGHVPQAVGLEHALASGMSTIDHLDGYVNAVAAPELSQRILDGEPVGLGQIVESATPERVRAVAQATRNSGTWQVPTMYLWENLFGAPNADEMLALPEMKYVSQQQRNAWRNQSANRGRPPAAVIGPHNQLRRDILKALSDAGVGILMGTDSPQMFNVPGFALHREIEVMSEAGMTNYDVLVSGTRNVAQYVSEELGKDGNFGTVERGQRADLVLLDANPLSDLGNLNRRAGVMVKGHWISGEELERGLERLAAKHAG